MKISKEDLSCEEVLSLLQDGEAFIRPEQTKITITTSSTDDFYLSAYGETVRVPAAQTRLIDALNKGEGISLDTVGDSDEALKFITAIYNKNFLFMYKD